ncbi:MAG: radical SAM protein [Myxococcota bacterium]|nr:radical SAM protein [Myxococcota bacterium]
MNVLVVSGSTARLPDPVYPLGAAMVGSAARRAGHEVSWFDALRHAHPTEALEQQCQRVQPQAVLLSVRNIDSSAFPSPILHYEEHAPMAQAVRRGCKAPIIAGGSGFSLLPDQLQELLGADCGVVGDGELVLPRLLDLLSRGEPLPRRVYAEPAPPPYLTADRDLFEATWYYETGGVANVQTKRGCPMGCVYCTYPLLEGQRMRLAEPGAVVDELEALSRAGIRHFFFVDAVFNQPEHHAMAVCEEIIRRDLSISFSAYFVPKLEDPRFPELLRRAGCDAVEFGTDSLSDKVLDAMAKGFTVDEALRAARAIAEQGLLQCHNLILGGPGETPATMDESIRRMDELHPKAVFLTLGLRVYPGTRLAKTQMTRLGLDQEPGACLNPVFYISEAVEDILVERATQVLATREGWVCPGLGKRYNPRYLERLRSRKARKGVLWTLFE